MGLYAFSGTGESDKNIQASYQNMKVTPLEVGKPSVREKMELYSGQSSQLAADLGEDDYAAAYYESSDPSVASVDDDGKVTAKRSGTAELTTKVTYYGRTVHLKTKITVKTPYVSIISAPSSMYEGQSSNISAKATGVSGNIVWKADNASCASISSSGKLTAKKAGKVYITAKVGVYSTKKMIVIKRPYIKITSCPSSVYTGKSVQLKAQAVGVSGKVAWSVSRRSLASVSASGKLSAKKAGKITVTAKLKNYSKKVKVTIKKPYLKITSYRKTVKRRKSYRFRAKAYGTSKSVKWSLSSKSKKYASISKSGKLTTKSRKGTITVYIESGSVKKTLKVKIK